MAEFVRQKDIAKLCGVSQATVSRALKNDPRIAESVREMVKSMARQHGYVLNPAMQTLSGHRWTPDKVSLPNIATIHEVRDSRPSNERASYMIDYAASLGYHMSVFALSDYQRRSSLRRALHARGIRGLVFDTWHKGCGEPQEWEEFACIVIGSRFVPSPFELVTFDHYRTLRTALQGMLQRGYRRIGCVLFHSASPRDDDMRTGAVEGTRQRYPDNILPLTFFPTGTNNLKPELTEYLEAHHPDGLVLFNNFMRAQLIDLGVRVPEDIGIFVLHEPDPRYRYEIATPFFDEQALSRVAVNRLKIAMQTGERGIPMFPCTVNVALQEYNWATVPERHPK